MTNIGAFELSRRVFKFSNTGMGFLTFQIYFSIINRHNNADFHFLFLHDHCFFENNFYVYIVSLIF